MTTNSSRLTSDLLLAYAVAAVIGSANLVCGVWFARCLGPASIGQYAAISTSILLLAGIIAPGFDQAIIRFPNRRNLMSAALIATHFQVAVLVLLASTIRFSSQLWTPAVAGHFLLPAGMVISSVALGFYASLEAAPLAARLQYFRLNITRLSATAIGIVLSMTLAVWRQSQWAIFARDLAIPALLLLFLVPQSPFKWSCRTNIQSVRTLVAFNGPLWAITILERIAIRIDYALVGIMLGTNSLGIYFAVRGAIEGISGFLVNPVQTVLFGHQCASGDSVIAKDLVLGRAGAAFWILLLLLVPVSYVALHPLIPWVFGTHYSMAIPLAWVIPILVGGTVWYEILKVSLVASGRHFTLILPRAAQIAVLVAGIAALVPTHGIAGAASASAMATVVLALAASVAVMLTTARSRSGATLSSGSTTTSIHSTNVRYPREGEP